MFASAVERGHRSTRALAGKMYIGLTTGSFLKWPPPKPFPLWMLLFQKLGGFEKVSVTSSGGIYRHWQWCQLGPFVGRLTDFSEPL